jgi:hypothetical protein
LQLDGNCMPAKLNRGLMYRLQNRPDAAATEFDSLLASTAPRRTPASIAPNFSSRDRNPSRRWRVSRRSRHRPQSFHRSRWQERRLT